MTIGRIIYELRKARGMTQDQLALAIGVSAPAVSKWETGRSLPDIGLLAPIARILGTDIDYLLSYKRDLSEEDVEKLWDNIRERAEKDGLEKGVEYAFSMLQEYPNSDSLKFRVASSITSLVYTMANNYTENDCDELEKVYRELKERTMVLFEELVNVDNTEVRNAAAMGLALEYMGRKRFDEAEKLLKSLPKIEHNAEHMLPTLYLLKEDYEASLKMTQQNLMMDMQNVMGDIMSQYNVRMRQERYDEALFFAESYRHITKQFGLFNASSGADLFVSLYLKKGELQNALKWFSIYVDELINMDFGYGDSPYFDTLEMKATPETVKNIQKSIFKSIRMNPMYAVFKDEPDYERAIKKLEHKFGD